MPTIREYRDNLLKKAHKKGWDERHKKVRHKTSEVPGSQERSKDIPINVPVEDMLKVHPKYKSPVKKSKKGQNVPKRGQSVPKRGQNVPKGREEVRIRDKDYMETLEKMGKIMGWDKQRVAKYSIDKLWFEAQKELSAKAGELW